MTRGHTGSQSVVNGTSWGTLLGAPPLPDLETLPFKQPLPPPGSRSALRRAGGSGGADAGVQGAQFGPTAWPWISDLASLILYPY